MFENSLSRNPIENFLQFGIYNNSFLYNYFYYPEQASCVSLCSVLAIEETPDAYLQKHKLQNIALRCYRKQNPAWRGPRTELSLCNLKFPNSQILKSF